MNFTWKNWVGIFLVGQKAIPYIIEIEFYDTGFLEVITQEIKNE